MTFRSSPLTMWLVAAALAAAPLRAQTAPSPAPQSSAAPGIKVEVRIVLLDVVVTNDNGAPVNGLAKDQFEVWEDGAPQSLSFFEEHARSRPAPEPAQTAARESPAANVYTNSQTTSPSDTVNVLLLDWLNTQP